MMDWNAPGGTVNHQAPRPLIEAQGASRLNTSLFVETGYPCYPQSDTDENGTPKRAAVLPPDIQPRVSNDTPSFDALTIVAPIVRFNERRADEMILRAGPPPLSIQVVQHFAGPAFTGGPNIC